MAQGRQTDAATSRPDDGTTWSTLMARAQDGDEVAYRRLLEDATPYLRSLAARHRALAGETEDVVQDILLTLHAVRHTYDPGRPFGPGWSRSRGGASSTGCAAAAASALPRPPSSPNMKPLPPPARTCI